MDTTVKEKLTDPSVHFVLLKQRNDEGIWTVQAHVRASLLDGKVPEWLAPAGDSLASTALEFGTEAQATAAETELAGNLFALLVQARTTQKTTKQYTQTHLETWKAEGRVPDVEAVAVLDAVKIPG